MYVVTYRLLLNWKLFTFSLLQKSLSSWIFIHTVSYLYVSPNVVSKEVVEISGLCQRERGQHHWLDCPTNKTSICSRKPNQMEETCLPDKDKFAAILELKLARLSRLHVGAESACPMLLLWILHEHFYASISYTKQPNPCLIPKWSHTLESIGNTCILFLIHILLKSKPQQLSHSFSQMADFCYIFLLMGGGE